MSPAGTDPRRPTRRRLPDGLGLWGACFAGMLGLHLGAVAFALAPGRPVAEGVAEDVVTIDMTPDLSSDAEMPDDVAGPQVTESIAPTSTTGADDPEPPAPNSLGPTATEEKAPDAAPDLTAPPAPTPSDVTLPAPVDAWPAEIRPETPPPVEPPREPVETADERQDTVQSRASEGSAGLLGGGKRPSAAAQATWRGALGRHLVRFRRYPAEARDGRQQGTARVRVTIDGDGRVLGRDLVGSSGHPLLDREALEMMTRSEPFPKPPPGQPLPVVLNVPVNFAIR